MEQRHKAEMIRVLDARLNAQSLNDRAVFLFGHCNATEEMADYLLTRGVNPAAILDNNHAKQGLHYRDIQILPPECIQEYTSENSIVLIATRFFAEMSAQLMRLGYRGEIVQAVEYDSFSEYSLSDETLNRRTERMRRGLRTLGIIRERYAFEHLIICPGSALGDVYWAMAFAPAYQRRHGIDEIAVIVTGGACRQVAKMFRIDKITALTQTEMDELVQAIIFTREGNCIIAHHDRPYTDNIIKWLDNHFLSFIDCYRCAVYGLPQKTPAAFPNNTAAFENLQRIPQGNAVILSPYAKSMVELPIAFWERTAAKYSAQGFSVYTNAVGDEQAISGTLPIRIPISQMPAAAEYAGTFIGIRNGLCDVLYTANCRKTVVFPDCFYSTTPHKAADFFSLSGWDNLIVNSESEIVARRK